MIPDGPSAEFPFDALASCLELQPSQEDTAWGHYGLVGRSRGWAGRDGHAEAGFAVVLTAAVAVAYWRMRTRPSGLTELACIYGFTLEAIALLRGRDLTTAILPFVLALVLMAMTAPALTVMLEQVRLHDPVNNTSTAPDTQATSGDGPKSAPESPLTKVVSDFQTLTAAISAVVLFGGVALIPFVFHIDDTVVGTAFEFVAGLAVLIGVVWRSMQRFGSAASLTLVQATRWLVVGNLAAVLLCWLASYGVLGAPVQPLPAARDVIRRVQASDMQEQRRLPGDAATYRANLTVPSQEDLRGRFVWVANVQKATDRGPAQLPAAAFAEVPCIPC